MTVRGRTRRVSSMWFYPRDIADDMGVSVATACRLIRRIPGAERMYSFDGRKGERWHVSKADYAAWRASERIAG